MNKKSRPRFFSATAAAIVAGVAAWGVQRLLSHFHQERDHSLQYLATNSEVVHTALGPVEVSIEGNGPPVLVVHGAAGGYDQGKLKSEDFKDITYISVSRPGYLRTPLSTGVTPNEQADAMAALLDTLGIDQTIFIGTSTGGLIGANFALRHPDRCRALVLISAVNSPLSVSISPLAVFAPLLADDFLPWMLMNTENLLRVRPELRKQLAAQPEKRDLIDQLIQTAYPTSMRLSGMLNDAIQIDHLSPIPLEQIQVPTLVIHGTNDEVVPFEQGVRSASRIPKARFLPVPGGSHYCALTNFELTFPAIKKFIREQVGSEFAKHSKD